jgi:hypothetical protein
VQPVSTGGTREHPSPAPPIEGFSGHTETATNLILPRPVPPGTGFCPVALAGHNQGGVARGRTPQGPVRPSIWASVMIHRRIAPM